MTRTSPPLATTVNETSPLVIHGHADVVMDHLGSGCWQRAFETYTPPTCANLFFDEICRRVKLYLIFQSPNGPGSAAPNESLRNVKSQTRTCPGAITIPSPIW